MDLQTKLVAVKGVLSEPVSPGAAVPDAAARQRLESKWDALDEAAVRCQKVLMIAVHVSDADRNYFVGYAQRIGAVFQKRTANNSENLKALEKISGEYPDFLKRIGLAARPTT